MKVLPASASKRIPMLATLMQEKIIAIVRGVPTASADQVADALAAGGIRLIEVTMNTAGAPAILGRWRERFAGRLRVGAGTVLDLEMARCAVSAGAEFLIAPNLDEEVIAYGDECGITVWPGAMTPTEIVRAWKAGASAVKVFPTGGQGSRYIREIHAPLDRIPLIAVGGVDIGNLRGFLEAGAVAVGVGSSLVDRACIHDGRFSELTALARRFVEAAHGPA